MLCNFQGKLLPNLEFQVASKMKLTSIDSHFEVGIEILTGGFKYFLFLPLFGEDSHFD